MKKRLRLLSAFVLYTALMMVLMQFNLALMIQPLPLVSVLAGIVILTLFRYKKGTPLHQLVRYARWNSLFSGALTSLFSFLSMMSEGIIGTQAIMQRLIPVVYGSIAYMLFHLALSFMKTQGSVPAAQDIFAAQTAIPILREKGFSERESHVALKLLEELPNKQIANQLFISESTVKKHIQNLFRKCGAADRHDFIRLYTDWAKEQLKQK